MGLQRPLLSPTVHTVRHSRGRHRPIAWQKRTPDHAAVTMATGATCGAAWGGGSSHESSHAHEHDGYLGITRADQGAKCIIAVAGSSRFSFRSILVTAPAGLIAGLCRPTVGFEHP